MKALSTTDLTASDKERFERHVKITEGCHIWTSDKTNGGYGRFFFKGQARFAHRIAYMLYKGEINQLRVCHSCDNPSCVNPDHLFLGTSLDNTTDMMNKNRGNKAFGEKSGNSKLSEADVIFILKNRDKIPTKAMSEMYNVSKTNIKDIKKRKTWKHIKL